MNVLRWGTNVIEKASPTGLILAGTALAIASPPVRKRLRVAAVMATRGVLTVTDTLKSTVSNLREGMDNIVTEAKEPSEHLATDQKESSTIVSTAKKQGRRLAVTAATGALAVRDELQSIVEEAKTGRQTEIPEADEPPDSEHHLDHDGLEAGEVDIGPDAQRRKRSRAKEI